RVTRNDERTSRHWVYRNPAARTGSVAQAACEQHEGYDKLDDNSLGGPMIHGRLRHLRNGAEIATLRRQCQTCHEMASSNGWLVFASLATYTEVKVTAPAAPILIFFAST